MRAVVNCSLDEKLGAHLSVERRFRMVMAVMRLVFRDVEGQIQVATYDGPDGPVREHCAVVSINCDGPVVLLERELHHIAASMGQDCVAVMVDGGVGKCIGPGAHRWPFDIKFFKQPVTAQQQAA